MGATTSSQATRFKRQAAEKGTTWTAVCPMWAGVGDAPSGTTSVLSQDVIVPAAADGHQTSYPKQWKQVLLIHLCLSLVALCNRARARVSWAKVARVSQRILVKVENQTTVLMTKCRHVLSPSATPKAPRAAVKEQSPNLARGPAKGQDNKGKCPGVGSDLGDLADMDVGRATHGVIRGDPPWLRKPKPTEWNRSELDHLKELLAAAKAAGTNQEEMTWSSQLQLQTGLMSPEPSMHLSLNWSYLTTSQRPTISADSWKTKPIMPGETPR